MTIISIYIKGVFDARSAVEYRDLTFDQISRSLKLHVRNGHVRIRTLYLSRRSYRATSRYFYVRILSGRYGVDFLGRASGPDRVSERHDIGSSNLLVHPTIINIRTLNGTKSRSN